VSWNIVLVEGSASPEDIQMVKRGLIEYNRSYAPESAPAPVVVLLRTEDGQVSGGLLAETYWGWLHIHTLWVDEDARRQHNGTAMMQAAEDEAMRRGCHHSMVDTMSWQALPFYLKRGYTVWGELNDFPTGHKRHFLQKVLA
jgi:GNAT superfamily N-acetyltransferase